MDWNVPKIWNKGDVWIIGGGPSIVKQFAIPQEVVNEVVTGHRPLSVYSDYMQCIHNKHIIGVNVAYLIGTWVDMVFFGDNNFFLKHKKGLLEFPNIKVSCSNGARKESWIKYLSQDPTKVFGITTNSRTVSWNKNSGSAAINVAVHTGAKRIFLLGFDMRLNGDNAQHFHGVYHNGGTPKDVRKLPFNRHLQGFPTIATDAKRLGVEIINVNPESAITNFVKVDLEQALKM